MKTWLSCFSDIPYHTITAFLLHYSTCMLRLVCHLLSFLAKLWAARSLSEWTSKRTGWRRRSLAVGLLCTSSRQRLRKFWNKMQPTKIVIRGKGIAGFKDLTENAKVIGWSLMTAVMPFVETLIHICRFSQWALQYEQLVGSNSLNAPSTNINRLDKVMLSKNCHYEQLVGSNSLNAPSTNINRLDKVMLSKNCHFFLNNYYWQRPKWG